MSSLGDFDTGTVIFSKFTSYRPSTGAPFTLAGTPALSVYKDNSVTQSTAGVTLTVDFDAVTGLHHFTIDTSADGAFYAAGSFFDVVITAGTVDSVSAVGTVVGRFTLRKNSALKPATAGRTLVVDAAGLADANMVKAGPTGAGTAQTAGDIIGDTNDIQARLPAALVSGRIDASVGAMAADVMTAAAAAADLTTELQAGLATSAALATLQTTATAIDGKTTNLPSDPADQSLIIAATNAIVALLGTPAGASLAADLAAVAAKTVNLPASPAAVGSAMTLSSGERDATADALLARNVSGGSSAGRTVKQALHILRNKTSIAGGTLTVTDVDDTTASWTAAVTMTAGDPISAIDPA